MIFNWECLVDHANGEQETKEKLLKHKIKEISEKFGIDSKRFTVWRAPFKLSKAGPILQGSPSDRDYSDEEEQQLIHILAKGAATSTPLIDYPNSISHHLAKLKYMVLRVYYLMQPCDPTSLKYELKDAFADV